MCRRVNQPQTDSRGKTCLHGWHMPGTRTWISQFPLFPVKSGSLCLRFVQTVWFMLNTCFPSGGLEFWYVLGRRCLCDQAPMKTLGIESLMSFSSRLQFTCVKLSVFCVTLLGKDSWKLAPGLLCTLPIHLFPLLIFCLLSL